VSRWSVFRMTRSTAAPVPRRRSMLTACSRGQAAFSRQPIVYSTLRSERLFVPAIPELPFELAFAA